MITTFLFEEEGIIILDITIHINKFYIFTSDYQFAKKVTKNRLKTIWKTQVYQSSGQK